MGNCIRKYIIKKKKSSDIKLNLIRSKPFHSNSFFDKISDEEKKHLNVDQVFEEIKDIKHLQIKGTMLLNETTGKPKDFYDTLNNIAQCINIYLTIYNLVNYGSIKKVKHKISGKIRTERLIKKELIEVKEEETLIFKEIALLRTLDHPNIIKLYEFYRDEKFYYLFSDFCEEGELFKVIKKEPKGFPEVSVAHIMKQLLSAVNYCHVAHNVVNRDLKCENILVESIEYKILNNQRVPLYNIKISDFKSARSYKTSKKLNKKVGNPYYIAPEVLKRKYNEKCDLWSCGIIMYMLLTGKPPYSGNTSKEILSKVRTGTLEFFETDLAYNSQECKSLLKELLRFDPDKRPSAATALRHDWFKNNKIDLDLNMRFVYESFNNFWKFSAELKFQQAALAYMVHHLVDVEDIKEIKMMFEMFDKDCDGRLVHAELVDGFKRYLKIIPNEKDLFIAIKKIDQDVSGYIDYEEFIRATINKKKLLSDENLRIVFKLFDKDNSGSITPQELKAILGISNKYSDEVWDDIINEIEHNHDNEVTYEEFRNMMRKMII